MRRIMLATTGALVLLAPIAQAIAAPAADAETKVALFTHIYRSSTHGDGPNGQVGTYYDLYDDCTRSIKPNPGQETCTIVSVRQAVQGTSAGHAGDRAGVITS